MPSFRQGEVVKVPFPCTDRATRQRRPALVVSTGGIEAAPGLLWVAMITSAENRGWPEDVPIADLVLAGLPAPSIIRPAKIATIQAGDAEPIGTVPAEVAAAVLDRIGRELGR